MRFEFIAGALCLDFANTIHNSHAHDKGEELHDVSDLLQWAREARLLSSADHERFSAHYSRSSSESAAALAEALTIRDLLLSIFGGIADGHPVSHRRVSDLNAALARTPGLLRVHKKADRIEKEWTGATDGLQQVLFPVLTSAAELLASDRLGRIRGCASADCTWLFLDVSRNGRRRWCDMSVCGNRTKARRHYQRAKAAQ